MIAMKSRLMLEATLLFLLSGCSTIVNGTKQDVDIKTYPSGLKAQIKFRECITPCTMTDVSRSSDSITIYMLDNTSKQFELEKTFNGWSVIAGNLLHPVAILIDVAAGSTHSISPVNVTIK